MSKRKIRPLDLNFSDIGLYNQEDYPQLLTPNRLSKVNNLFNPDQITVEIFKQRYNTKNWPPTILLNNKINKN